MTTQIGDRLNAVAGDMQFFWNEAAGEMGQRSTWNVPENPYKPINRPRDLRCGPIFVATPKPAQRTYEMQGGYAVNRYARVEEALACITPEARELLRLAYADDRPSVLREVFHSCAPVAEVTATAKAAHAQSRSTNSVRVWLEALCGRVSRATAKAKRAAANDRELVEAIRVDASRILLDAEREYLRAKGGVPRRPFRSRSTLSLEVAHEFASAQADPMAEGTRRTEKRPSLSDYDDGSRSARGYLDWRNGQ